MEIDDFLDPMGAYISIMKHPFTKDAIEVAVFHEHRVAFYYWALWSKGIEYSTPQISSPPTLVSFDWHEDTVVPDEVEQEELKNLNLEKKGDIAFFSGVYNKLCK